MTTSFGSPRLSQSCEWAELSASFSGGEESVGEGGAQGSATLSQRWKHFRQAGQPKTQGTFRDTADLRFPTT